ncbi:hypothetical protein JFQ72_004380 [Vibrio parahaemolyticus]|nr:hypothetical protein [Vibrio parahaemolyticus]
MFDILKSPLFYLACGAMVIVTNSITYNISSAQTNSCDVQIQTALNELRQELQEKDADISKALAPNPTPLNDNRQGGLSWNN